VGRAADGRCGSSASYGDRRSIGVRGAVRGQFVLSPRRM